LLFSESFSHCPKNVSKLPWKRNFEIVFCLESADSNCTAVSEGGKIQNTKLRLERIFWALEIMSIFFRGYRTCSLNLYKCYYSNYSTLLYVRVVSHWHRPDTRRKLRLFSTISCKEKQMSIRKDKKLRNSVLHTIIQDPFCFRLIFYVYVNACGH